MVFVIIKKKKFYLIIDSNARKNNAGCSDAQPHIGFDRDRA